ncbi:MAG: hypothetical protein ACR2KV_16115 [Solirubrobacteraceae bacterium]
MRSAAFAPFHALVPALRPGGRQRRLLASGLLALIMALPLTLAAPAAVAGASSAPAKLQLARLGGFRLGGGGFSSRPRSSLFGRRAPATRSRGILRRIGHALAFAAVLHFLFAGSHGLGFVFLLLLVGLALFALRRRRRQPVYRTRW